MRGAGILLLSTFLTMTLHHCGEGSATNCIVLTPSPVGLDLLWVMDDSSGMVGHQQSLPRSIDTFLTALEPYGVDDLRVAFTTTNVCEEGKSGAIRGKFLYQPSGAHPPAGIVWQNRYCETHADCVDAAISTDPDDWRCVNWSKYSADPDKSVYFCDHPETSANPTLVNLSSRCQFRCNREEDAAGCARIYGRPDTCADDCDLDWDCAKRCETFLFDAEKCATVCGSQECFHTCADEEFRKQDFLCSLVCADEYTCQDICIARSGEPTYRCLYPGGDYYHAGCILPPPTSRCPDQGPVVLDKEVVNGLFEEWNTGTWAGDPRWLGLNDATVRRKIFEQLFVCMGTVGAHQNICGTQEQGLLAAWLALDRNGENAEQAISFLRDEALLLVVIASNDDDYSTVEKVPAVDFHGISCMADTSGCTPEGTCEPAVPGPLKPTSEFVTSFQSLKSDSAWVTLATITGDIIPGSSTTPTQDLAAIRERYYECRCSSVSGSTGYIASGTHICTSHMQEADLGTRYHEVVKGLGPDQALTLNICDDTGFENPLKQIADALLPRLTRICLTPQVSLIETVAVARLDPSGAAILQIPDTDYSVDDGAPGCSGLPALRFREPLRTSESVRICMP